MSDKDDLILKQSFNGGSRNFEIIDDEKIILRKRKGQKKTQHIISLLALDAEGRNIIKARWVYLALGIAIPTILLLFVMFGSLENPQQVILTVVSILLFSFSIYLFIRSLSRQYIFSTRHSKIPVMELSINTPNKKEFEDFKNQIKEKITNIQDKQNFSPNNLLAGEMRMLRRLESEGLIDKKIYETAREKLLNQFGSGQESSSDL
jgi:hypothetical protein